MQRQIFAKYHVTDPVGLLQRPGLLERAERPDQAHRVERAAAVLPAGADAEPVAAGVLADDDVRPAATADPRGVHGRQLRTRARLRAPARAAAAEQHDHPGSGAGAEQLRVRSHGRPAALAAAARRLRRRARQPALAAGGRGSALRRAGLHPRDLGRGLSRCCRRCSSGSATRWRSATPSPQALADVFGTSAGTPSTPDRPSRTPPSDATAQEQLVAAIAAAQAAYDEGRAALATRRLHRLRPGAGQARQGARTGRRGAEGARHRTGRHQPHTYAVAPPSSPATPPPPHPTAARPRPPSAMKGPQRSIDAYEVSHHRRRPTGFAPLGAGDVQ